MESHFCTFYKGFAKFSCNPYYDPLTRVHDTLHSNPFKNSGLIFEEGVYLGEASIQGNTVHNRDTLRK